MRIELLPITGWYDGFDLRLSISAWYVGVFPLTFTVQECVETYCDFVGWKFILLQNEYQYAEVKTYSMRFEVPVGENSTHTTRNMYYYGAGLEGL